MGERLDLNALRCDAIFNVEPFSVFDRVISDNTIFLEVKIDDLDEARAYIDGMDFSMLKAKIMSSEDGGLGWSQSRADAVEQLYKQLLFLKRKHPDGPLPPPADVDMFWHFHILDTIAYHRDCAAIFGQYLHHFPYFGMRGPEDEQALTEAFERTKQLYKEEFGVDIDQPVHI